MLSLPVCLKQLGSFLEHNWLHFLFISLAINTSNSFLNLRFFHAATAICLYVPLTSILPKDSKSSGSFLSTSFEGQFTLTNTLVVIVVCVTFVASCPTTVSTRMPLFCSKTIGDNGKEGGAACQTGDEVEVVFTLQIFFVACSVASSNVVPLFKGDDVGMLAKDLKYFSMLSNSLISDRLFFNCRTQPLHTYLLVQPT